MFFYDTDVFTDVFHFYMVINTEDFIKIVIALYL